MSCRISKFTHRIHRGWEMVKRPHLWISSSKIQVLRWKWRGRRSKALSPVSWIWWKRWTMLTLTVSHRKKERLFRTRWSKSLMAIFSPRMLVWRLKGNKIISMTLMGWDGNKFLRPKLNYLVTRLRNTWMWTSMSGSRTSSFRLISTLMTRSRLPNKSCRSIESSRGLGTTTTPIILISGVTQVFLKRIQLRTSLDVKSNSTTLSISKPLESEIQLCRMSGLLVTTLKDSNQILSWRLRRKSTLR